MVQAKISLPILFVFHLFTHSFFFKFSIFFPSTLAYFVLSVLLLSSTYLSFLSPCFLLLFLLFILPLFFLCLLFFFYVSSLPSIPYLYSFFRPSLCHSFLRPSLSFLLFILPLSLPCFLFFSYLLPSLLPLPSVSYTLTFNL